MKVKTIEVCNATNMDGRNIFGMRNLSRLLLASLTKSTLPRGESKRGDCFIRKQQQTHSIIEKP